MPRPKVTSQMTTTQVAKQLSIGESRLLNWIKRGVLPAPSFTDNNGVRYFDAEWLKKSQEIVKTKKGNIG
jgi:DNA-binding transcriptional MerR regulator